VAVRERRVQIGGVGGGEGGLVVGVGPRVELGVERSEQG